MSAKMNMALSNKYEEDEDETIEDKILKILEGRKMLTNASYFAVTVTPKNKILEMFGVPYSAEGKIKHRPFHVYNMKQAVQKEFIIDVLKDYTPIKSYYKIARIVKDGPMFNK